MMIHSLLATLVITVHGADDEATMLQDEDTGVLQANEAASEDDEALLLQDEDNCVLQAKSRKLKDVVELQEKEQEGDSNSYCSAIFHSSADSVTTCQNCVTTVKGDNSLGTTVMAKSPWFVKEVATCLLERKAAGDTVELPSQMANRLAACAGIFGQQTCVAAVAHCTAIHAEDGLAECPAGASPEDQFNCVADHRGYLFCIAHNVDHEFCLDSSMGAGNCMKAGIECLDGGFSHGSDEFKHCFGQKRHTYFQDNPAQKEVYDLCEQYYGQNHVNDQVKKVAMAKCGGCAMKSKMEFGITNGVKCQREHCLRIPAFVQGVTQCMMDPDVPCDMLNTAFVPAPFQNAVTTCQAVFPLDPQECLRNGAQCLALHPCGDSATCANDDGWFSCFAKKMDHTACERHPAGMAICLKCGVGLVKNGICDSGEHCVQQYENGNAAVVGAHNLCVQSQLEAAR
jgi:hypothetical protein